MKTKIIYISGNEIFDIADIRAAFEEVRVALNLDKDTVLFGVPVDQEDAMLSPQSIEPASATVTPDDIVTDKTEIEVTEIIEPETKEEIEPKKTKKRTRSVKKENTEEQIIESTEPVSDTPAQEDDKIIPILSVLSVNEENSDENEPEIAEIVSEETEEETENVEPEISQAEVLTAEETEQIADATDIDDSEEPQSENSESDLEQLLSAMKPLEEDSLEEQPSEETVDTNEEENIDATLEQLATEFVKTQDKISSERKTSSRSKIGKLRNILPFKQSKNKDQGLGDLFGWAGVAANDEDFSVPGFFTNASSRK